MTEDLPKGSAGQGTEGWSLVTARLVESVQRTVQLAGGLSPDMQELFDAWIAIVSRRILEKISPGQTLNLEEEAREWGLSPSAYLGLIVALHRRGELCIDQIAVRRTHDANRELCPCLREEEGGSSAPEDPGKGR